jgi:hypothetical protein
VGVSDESLGIGNGFPGEVPDRPEKLLIKRSFNDTNILLKTGNNGG